MDDNRNAAQAVGRAKARRPRPDGIIGRLTYTPARQGDDGIGQLRRNRAKDETPRFKQVTPFTPWCAPTRTVSQPSGMRPSQLARVQENWLLEYLPEASIDDEDIESLLVQEIAAAQPKKHQAPTDPASRFSIGEITDHRESDVAIRGHHVIAIASGVAGNVLRLISLAREEWAWAEADIRVRVRAANSQLEGEWCQGDMPITLIKFATDSRKSDPIRWLLVQNGTSTVLYEPELRAMPMPTARTSAWTTDRSVASQIFANPLFTIPYERTGGGLQTDVCFSRDFETDKPGLVIIDQCGCWSLWDITGRRDMRPKTLTPVMRMCGDIVSGHISRLPSSPVAEPRPHRILFLAAGQRRSGPSSREPSPGHEAEQAQNPQRLLLLGNPKALHLFDLAAGRLQSFTHLVLPKDTHRILGAAPSRLDPCQAFILTSTNLLWVAARERKDNTVTLDILVSCPHQKDINDPTLQLDVSPGAYINDLMACFVCVRSTQDTEMTVFWFINPEPGTPVRYHRDIISLQSPSKFIGLSIIPAGRRMGEEPTSAAGRAMRKAQLRFFQLLTLGRDFDVHSALCAWSDDPSVTVPPPDSRANPEDGSSRRTRLLQSLGDAFVVPDEFDERAVFGKRELASLSLERSSRGTDSCLDFTVAAKRLTTAGEPPDGTANRVRSPLDSHDFGFIGEAIERQRQDGYMPRHSLLDLVTSHGVKEDLLQLAREWDAQQEALHRRTGEWSFVPEARRPVIDFGPDDLVERLRDMFDSQENGKAASRPNGEVLQNMAAEMFFSSIGISAIPQAWTAIDGPLSSSLPFPSSPSIMSSQTGFGSSSKASSGKTKDEDVDQEKGDSVVLRLRKYATINTSPKTRGEPTLALSRWDLGADPDDITWKPGQDLEAEDAINRRRKKIEARRRKAERLSQRILGDSLGGGSILHNNSILDLPTSSQTAGPSQPVPMILPTSSQMQQPWEFSSQQVIGTPRAFVGSPLRKEYRRDSLRLGLGASSQTQGQSQGTPSQPRSQVLPGAFGGRLSPFKKSPVKKMKRKSELRLSGFR